MGWMNKLCEAYDLALESFSGSSADNSKATLIPIGMIKKSLKYTVTINHLGEFENADALADELSSAIVPTTAQAEARTGNPAPYPLAEQLQYFILNEDGESPLFDSYIAALRAWSEHPSAPEALSILLTYLEKRTLIEDMHLTLPKFTPEKEQKSFVCFVLNDSDVESRLWMRKSVIKSWQEYSSAKSNEIGELCYVSGEQLPIMESHPKVEGNAKLISAKDGEFRFQYRGRFIDTASSTAVSAVASTKAHNAFKWLVENQGMRKLGLTSVTWNINGCPMTTPIDDDDDDFISVPICDTFRNYSIAVKEAAEGYAGKLREWNSDINLSDSAKKRANEVCILCTEAATTGRLSITYYQEIPGNEYVSRLERWHTDCAWQLSRGKKGTSDDDPDFGKKRIRSPSFHELAEAIMGTKSLGFALKDFKCEKSDGKLYRELYLRILACIAEGASIPESYVRAAVRRTCAPLAFTDNNGKWMPFVWERTLNVTCALIRKHRIDLHLPEIFPCELDHSLTDRSYLYGRILAIADKLERDAVQEKPDYKTNAIRMMSAYVNNPAKVWRELHSKLLPYLKRLGADGRGADYYQKLIGAVETSFEATDRSDDSPLGELFLVGLALERRELWTKAELRSKAPEPSELLIPSDRDALFGSLLAIADYAERTSEADKVGERYLSRRDGATNALAYMSTFEKCPNDTWAKLHDRLIPYLAKLGERRTSYVRALFSWVEGRFKLSERISNEPLGAGWLNGYYRMLHALKCNKIDNDALKCERRDYSPESLTSHEAIYGALFSFDDKVERYVLDHVKQLDDSENRQSNTMRHLSKAAYSPHEMWENIDKKLAYYLKKTEFYSFKQAYARLSALIPSDDRPLGGEYLHYFYTFNDIKEREQ